MNLWAYADANGYVMRVAGKTYVMDGDDNEKLTLLRRLAETDFLSARWHPVPSTFSLNNTNGETMRGVAHASMVSDSFGRTALFGPLMEILAKGLPEQLRCMGDEYVTFRLELPEHPLSVVTVVMEYDDGRLVPMISSVY